MSDNKARKEPTIKSLGRIRYENLPPEERARFAGIGGTSTNEDIPKFFKLETENVLSGETNAMIVFGKDRVDHPLSGYGGRGDTDASSIDMIVGLGGYNKDALFRSGEDRYCNPSFTKDAARIFISQKTDIDKNFGIVEGNTEAEPARSGIALKADNVRIIGRESLKFVTFTDPKNSQGGIATYGGIDLVAGNDDSNLQPIPLGVNLLECLQSLTKQVNDLSTILSNLTDLQIEINNEVITHMHHSPFYALPTTPAEQLMQNGILIQAKIFDEVKKELAKFKINLGLMKTKYLKVAGERYILSINNSSN